MSTALSDLVVATKNHLDVGFTASTAKVLHDACRWLLPVAAAQAKRMRAAGDGDGLCWLVPSFIAEHALEILDGDTLRAVEEGFACGDLAWHALPFTTHTELLDQGLLDAATAVSRRLDARFGTHTTCAKLTDVPGHTLALVQALARAGIDFLHVGVNWMSPVPDVPPLARWRDGTGNEIVLAYSAGYSGLVQIPGEARGLLIDVVGDNMEVPSEADCRARLAGLRRDHPAARVHAGRAEQWAGRDLRARCSALPVVDAEIGDSWIHGTGSDPWKSARFRELVRLRREWLTAQRLLPGSKTLVQFDSQLLQIAEHTWGVNVAAHHHHDRVSWSNEDFARVRHRGCWRGLEASWQEQRDYVELAVEALDDPALRAEAQAACDGCAPLPPDRSGWEPVEATATHTVNGAQLRGDSRGALVSLLSGGTERITVGGALGLLRYRTFNDADCRRAVSEYCTITGEWLLEEFVKMGLAGSPAVSRWWEPQVVATWRRGDALAFDVVFPQTAVVAAGAPQRVTLTYRVTADGIAFDLAWWGKHPTRLPEAVWWTFQPAVTDDHAWRLDKAGVWIDPAAVVTRGGRWLHAVQSGARNGALRLLTRDAHLMAVGEPVLCAYPARAFTPQGGVHLNLVNNLWGTNFPQWCGDDLAFRASLIWK